MIAAIGPLVILSMIGHWVLSETMKGRNSNGKKD